MPISAPECLPAIDAYIQAARPFAQPILRQLRASVHHAVPAIEESLKWSRPFFLHRGVILANMSAFSAHCTFGLWGSEMASLLRAEGHEAGDAMGSFGRLTTVADLPPAPALERYLRAAASLIEDGARTKSIRRVAKPARSTLVLVPEALQTALATHPAAAKAFAAMSPSCRREYADWITEAKRDDTRSRRVAAALEAIAAGKGRHWRYETPSKAASAAQASTQSALPASST